MEEDKRGLLLHVSDTPEVSMDEALRTLWSTRRTGLSPLQTSTLQTLLHLSEPQHFHSVLACLRSIIRRSVNEDLGEDGIRKLLPFNLPKEFESTLLSLLWKHQTQWKEEASSDESLRPQTRASNHAQATVRLHHAVSTSESPLLTGPQRDESTVEHDSGSNGCHEPVPSAPPLFKSMTWTIENRSSISASQLAVITLKLEDNAKQPPGESEIKFHASKDTMEAMMRSMTYMEEQFSKSVAPSSGSEEKQTE